MTNISEYYIDAKGRLMRDFYFTKMNDNYIEITEVVGILNETWFKHEMVSFKYRE